MTETSLYVASIYKLYAEAQKVLHVTIVNPNPGSLVANMTSKTAMGSLLYIKKEKKL
jgi:hypothetical protein